jgi:hypothetical protein
MPSGKAATHFFQILAAAIDADDMTPRLDENLTKLTGSAAQLQYPFSGE